MLKKSAAPNDAPKTASTPALLGKAHKLTKNGSTGNVENSRGHA